MQILNKLIENPEILALLAVVVFTALGKGKEFLALWGEVEDFFRNADANLRVPISGFNDHVIKQLPKETKITALQVASVVKTDASGKMQINPMGLAKVVASSGDGKKAIRKIGKFFKKHL